MLGVDATVVNMVVPAIAQEFYAKLVSVQWVVNAFFIFASMVQVLGGHLGDSFGHKKTFLYALFLFVLSSLGAGISFSENMLILFRALQGVSIGIASPLTITLLAEAFPKEEQSYARSFTVASMGIALAIGAPLGGFFLHTLGWRWIFYINIPIGVFCFLVACIACKSVPSGNKKFDKIGMAFLMFALFILAFSLNQLSIWGAFSGKFLLGMVVSIALFFLLYRREKKSLLKTFDFTLFLERNFSINNFLRVVTQIIFLGTLFFAPLLLQNILGISPLHTGLFLLFLMLVITLISPFAGKWIDRSGDKFPNQLSMVFFMIASVCLIVAPFSWFLLWLCISFVFFGASIAISFVATIAGALHSVTFEKLGRASGIFFTIAWLACSLGVSITTAIIDFVATRSPFSQTPLLSRAAKGLLPFSVIRESFSWQTWQEVVQTFIQAIRYNAWGFFLLAFLGFFLSFFLKKRPFSPR